jgi:two-component system, LytTR family, response regulator
MPIEDGFTMLKNLGEYTFKVIFVTAHSEYAIAALRASAVDYLLKPVNIEELQTTVEKLKNFKNNTDAASLHKELVNTLLKSVSLADTPVRIAIPQLGRTSFLDVADIVALEADSNYTIVHKLDHLKVVVTKTLKEFEEILSIKQFVRIHKSYIVNIAYVKSYSTIDGGVVVMKDGTEFSVSRRQQDLFIAKLKEQNISFFK